MTRDEQDKDEVTVYRADEIVKNYHVTININAYNGDPEELAEAITRHLSDDEEGCTNRDGDGQCLGHTHWHNMKDDLVNDEEETG